MPGIYASCSVTFAVQTITWRCFVLVSKKTLIQLQTTYVREPLGAGDDSFARIDNSHVGTCAVVWCN
jgi:hypothetical protein